MAKKGSFSKVFDKNGDYVDVEAARFDGTRTFQMQGDVTALQTWNGDPSSPLTLNASIGAKKVTTDKINDKAVQTGQIDDGAVGLTQIATNAMNGTVQDNDSKLATHAAVKTYVDAQISGQGTYLGKHTVAEINAMVTDNLHNGDRVMTSDSGTINLGPGGVGFDVEAGEDLILYKSGSTVQWDSMDGNFKTKQTAVSDPTASGTGLTFIDSASQDENGEMTLSKKTVQDGTTSQKGVVQLEDSHTSTSTTKAATPNSVKEAYDLANTANTGAVKNVAYDSTNKKITKTINGQTTDVVSAATLKTDMALNNVDNTSDANKPVSTAQQAALDLKLDKTGDSKDVTATFTEASTRANIGTGEKLSVIFGKIKKWFSDLGTAAFKNVPASGNASSTEVVLGSDTRLSAGASAVQDVTVDGASVVNESTKVAAVPNASTSAKGTVQLASSIGATVASENNKAATEKAVRDAVDTRLPIYNVDQTLTSLDFNDFTSTGFHYCGGFDEGFTSYSHAPMSLARSISWRLEVINRRGRVEQILVLVGDADPVAKNYKRHRNSGNVWSDWQTFVFESDLSSYEQVSNKVSSWQTTPDNTHYPSEKLVKDGLDAKADANLTVSQWDASASSTAVHTKKWYKIAEKSLNGTYNPRKSVWSIRCGNASEYNSGILEFDVRSSQSTIITSFARLYCDGWISKHSVKVVSRGTVGNCMVELWVLLPVQICDVSVALLSYSVYAPKEKDSWTFYNINDAEGSDEPVTDAVNNVVATPVEIIYRQHNIASPTNNNLVAMDADGRIKDSGLAKSSVESAISYAGSAIQGVKVNNTTLTPDANKVVTVPLATTSADGAMSAADKTKLDNAAKYTQSSGTAPVKVDENGALTPVPMDSTPTASSTNLMTSGDIKTALDGKVDSYKRVGASASSADSNQHNWQKLLDIKLKGWSRYSAILFSNLQDTVPSGMMILNVSRLADGNGAPTSISIDTFGRTEQNPGSRAWAYSYDSTSNSTVVYTHSRYTPDPAFRLLYEYNSNPSVTVSWFTSTDSTTVPASSTEFNAYEHAKHLKGSTIGSTSVPAYVKSTGELAACTDDFVHDGDVAQTYSPTSEAPISGNGVSAALSPVNNVVGRRVFDNGSGLIVYKKVLSLSSANGDNRAAGCIFAFTSRDANSLNTNGRFIVKKKDSTFDTSVIIDGASSRYNHVFPARFLVKSVSTNEIDVYVKLISYSRIFITVVNEGGLSLTWGSNTSVEEPENAEGINQYEVVKKPTLVNDNSTLATSVGSSSVPVYVGSDGVIKACTDNFARDSEVVSSVQVETVNNVKKMNYTKNGSKTDILEFMTNAEARSVWTNAKAAVANAS